MKKIDKCKYNMNTDRCTYYDWHELIIDNFDVINFKRTESCNEDLCPIKHPELLAGFTVLEKKFIC